jgi:hypothetical protein
MDESSKIDPRAVVVAAATAVVGLATFGAIFYYVNTKGTGVEQWQALGMFVVAVGIAFAVVAMLRYALAPLISPRPVPIATDADAAIRSRIGPLVLSIGSIAIVVLAAALMLAFVVLASLNPLSQVASKIDTLLPGVFNTVLPVIATWVGTVLAFYFGSENFRQAAESTREALGQLAPENKIIDVMVPYERIGRLMSASDAWALRTRQMQNPH